MDEFEWSDEGRVASVNWVDPSGNELKISTLSGEREVQYLGEKKLQAGDRIRFLESSNGQLEEIQLMQRRSTSRLAVDLEFGRLQHWCHFLQLVRQYFMQAGFLETPTPTLVTSSGTETYLKPFSVTTSSKRFLPTSPEFSLKKLLSIGAKNIFEIRSCFRDEDCGPVHAQEFTMLEWYRAYSAPPRLMLDIEKLIEKIHQTLPAKVPTQVVKLSMRELYKEIGLDLSPQTQMEELADFCQRIGINSSATDSWDDLFFRIFLDKIEKELNKDTLYFIYDFPPQLSAYARINRAGWADRFEVYFQGLELANAYNELIDADEQVQRMKLENEKSINPVGVDEQFIEALRWGIPPCSGIALGLERLYMAMYGVDRIGQLPVQALGPQERDR